MKSVTQLVIMKNAYGTMESAYVMTTAHQICSVMANVMPSVM